jgi:hypothetical protein
VRAQSLNLRALGRTHPTGGVGGLPPLSHTPVPVSTAHRPSPGPRGHGDPPDAGLPVVRAALLPLSRLRSGPRLLLSPVSPRRPHPHPPRGRPAAPAESRRPPRPPRPAAGLPRPVPRPRDASDFPRPNPLWHPSGRLAPDAHAGPHWRRAWRLQCATRSCPPACARVPLCLLWPVGPVPPLGRGPRPPRAPAGARDPARPLSGEGGVADDPRRASRRDPPALLR